MKFVIENSLKELDVCLFDLLSRTNDSFVLDVKMFRVGEEASYFTKKGVREETGYGSKRRRINEESSEDADESSDDEKENAYQMAVELSSKIGHAKSTCPQGILYDNPFRVDIETTISKKTRRKSSSQRRHMDSQISLQEW